LLVGDARLRHGAALKKTATIASLLIALSAVAVVLALRVSDRDRPPAGVLIITLDTTRADRLSPYGFMSGPTPALDRLAAEGVLFDQAMTTAPLTLPAHTSLFTGLLPPRHGVRENADAALGTGFPTLAELLRAQGYRTGAFVGSVVLDAERGLSRGFDRYSGVAQTDGTRALQRPANAVADDAIAWLDSVVGSPFLLWAHFYDPHQPHDAPEPFRSSAADSYIAEIAFVDSQIGRLLDALTRHEVLENTVVIVVADHGESLGEHGERDHGIFLYDSVMRVPLIIKAPGAARARVAEIVRITDLMPTVLEMVGAPAPPMDGVSLSSVISGRARVPDLESYSESFYPLRFGWSPLQALRTGRFKFVESPRPELYDLDRDPFEEHNVYAERPQVASAMRTRLASIAASTDARQTANRLDTASPEVRQRLAALGYASNAIHIGTGGTANYPDAKDCIGGHELGPKRPECVAKFSAPVPARVALRRPATAK
jgi:arylsulfatase A-like enzyme